MSFMRRPWQYFYTLWYLKPRQLVWRAYYQLPNLRVDVRPAPVVRCPVSKTWRPVARRPSSMLGAAEFTFLNQRRQVIEAEDWNQQSWSKLWLYNLHYFDDLNAENAEARESWHRALLARWILENPPGHGAGWELYPVSVRMVNWIKWGLAGHALDAAWRESLAVQVRWLSARLEYHLLGNHLFMNAKALIFAGLFFSGEEACHWLNTGLKILVRELPEQVLPDGGQFERSPMYHALALEDVLDLINIAELYGGPVSGRVVASWSDVAARMLYWLRSMCHPDGEIVLFNDAAFGIAPGLAALEAYAERLGVSAAPISRPLAHLAHSGYVRAEMGPAVAFCDIAPLGPDYLPAHAHADTLSFELSLFGQRWVVDSGCSLYNSDSERLRQRGTAAHNTVVIDGQDSSEVWSSFRVGRRARVLDVSVGTQDGSLCISGAHNGYCRLWRKVIHRRRWRLSPQGLEVEDWLEGKFAGADAFLHFHPEVSVAQDSATSVMLRRENRFVRLICDGGNITVGQSTWHPEFGLALPSTRVRLQFQGARLLMCFAWQ